MAKTKPRDPVNQKIGRNLAKLREDKGIQAAQLTDILDVTPQQVSRYERGANRISACQLWRASIFIGTEIQHFFQGLERGDFPYVVNDKHNSYARKQFILSQNLHNIIDSLDLADQELLLSIAERIAGRR